MHIDKYGIIGQIQSDGSIEGGDSVNWMGHWLYLSDRSDDTAKKFINTFEVGFGAYVRHPYPDATYNGFGAYYKNPWDGCISRDQFTGLVGYLVASKQHGAIARILLHHLLRLMMFSYNTITNATNPATSKRKIPDLTLFDIWAMELRGLGTIVALLLYPILMICDLHILMHAIIHRFSKSDNDPISMVMKAMVTREICPTPISYLAWKLLDKTKLINDLKNYWCGWRDSCDIVVLYEKKLKELK